MLVRADKEHPNALLFHFENWENATKHLSPYPVRVYFDDSGKMVKADTHVDDTDCSLSTKKAVLLTTQLDWEKVTSALATNGPLEFKSVVKGKTKECNNEYRVDVNDDSKTTFVVVGERNVTECTGGSEHKDYEKYAESTKVWKFTFDTSKSSNFQALSVDVVDYFAPDRVVAIESGFTYVGCEEFSDVWDTNELVEDKRDYEAMYECRKQHKKDD